MSPQKTSAFITTLFFILSPVSPEPLVFYAYSTPFDIVVFAKNIHRVGFAANINVGPRCPSRQWKNISHSKDSDYTCLFTPTTNNVNIIITPISSITHQIFRCPHPHHHDIPNLIGAQITIRAHGHITPSTASYSGIPYEARPIANPALPTPLQPPFHTPPTFQLCACLIMWYRAEFLLEWIYYHTKLHNLQKIFIYDNGSDIDYLQDYVKILSSIIPVEIIAWPHAKSQLAFAGHCVLQAERQCDWVSFTDVDEFIHTKSGIPITQSLAALPPNVGGIQLKMLAMGPDNASTAIHKPLGGVIRNYKCKYQATNMKSIVRPRAIHFSLYNVVHLFCYAPGYIKRRYPSSADLLIYHYKTQAWDIHKRKYMRRASPGSKRFVMPKNNSIPPQTWFQDINNCKSTDLALFTNLKCSLSSHNCNPQTTNHKILITAPAGPGTGITWTKIALNHHPEFTVDWTVGLRPQGQYSAIFCQLETPLVAINALSQMPDSQWKIIANTTASFDFTKYTSPLHRALHFWIIRTQLLTIIADWVYKWESVSLTEICAKANISTCIHHSKSSSVPSLSWHHLTDIDPNASIIARNIATEYGY